VSGEGKGEGEGEGPWAVGGWCRVTMGVVLSSPAVGWKVVGRDKTRFE